MLLFFFSLQAFFSGLLSTATRIGEREKKLRAIPTRGEQGSINSAGPVFLTIRKALCSTLTKHVNFYFPKKFHFYLSEHCSNSDVVITIVFCFSLHVYIMCVLQGLEILISINWLNAVIANFCFNMFFSMISFQQIIRTSDDETFTNLCQTRIPFLWSSFGNGEKIVLRFVMVLVFIVIIKINEDE